MSTVQAAQSDRERVMNRLRLQIMRALEAQRGSFDVFTRPLDRSQEEAWREEFIQQASAFLETNGVQLRKMGPFLDNLADRVVELGPIADLILDETISEIMVVGPEQLYVEEKGQLVRLDRVFPGESELQAVVRRIVAALGRRIDENAPMVDARLGDGSRVNAVIPPIAVDGAMLTIRKFSLDIRSIDDYVSRGSASENMMKFLETAVQNRVNLVVSGGTGSGKTTLLNLLASFIPENERIVTIEDTAELALEQEHVGRMEARQPDTDGDGEVSIGDLFRNSLRMRPDRIIVGECRGPEAFTMLQAMNSGHDGSMTTTHANSPREAIDRIESLVLTAGLDLPKAVVRKMIVTAVDLLVQIRRYGDGSRKIQSITEITGVQGDSVSLSEVFSFEEEDRIEDKVVGSFQSAGFIPKFYEHLRDRGVRVPMNIFH